MFVRPLIQEGDDSCAFVYLKLSDSPKVGSRVHFDAQRTELGAVLAALGDGGGTRDPWLGRMLAEAVVINGSGSFDGVAWALIARGTLCPGHKRVPRADGIINFGRGL